MTMVPQQTTEMVATQVPKTIMQEIETRVEYQQYQQMSQPYTMAAQPVAAPMTMAAPTMSYAAPTTSYAAPTYAAPTTSYAAPATYGAPMLGGYPGGSIIGGRPFL